MVESIKSTLESIVSTGKIELHDWLSKSNIDVTDENGNSCLHHACLQEIDQIFNTLLSSGCNVKLKNKLGRTSLYIASEKGFTEKVKTLLMYGAEVMDLDNVGESALHAACRNLHLDTCFVLVENGGDVTTKNAAGHSPLDLIDDSVVRDELADFAREILLFTECGSPDKSAARCTANDSDFVIVDHVTTPSPKLSPSQSSKSPTGLEAKPLTGIIQASSPLIKSEVEPLPLPLAFYLTLTVSFFLYVLIYMDWLED